MPFDASAGAVPAQEPQSPSARPVAIWLFVMCGMIAVMVTLGGVTRLTGSGLSIMEWAPLSGLVPPWSEAEWRRLLSLYQQIPQYRLLNEGFGLDGFKHIFWLEWAHRLWGRLIGIAFIGPLIVLWVRGRITRPLVPRLLLLFSLGGLQGAVGWFMVASGLFPDSTAVSPYRLVVHLVLALLLYGALLWTALTLMRPVPLAAPNAPRRLLISSACLVALTIVAGGFVAGLHAGLTYNTFPLMDARLVPLGYAMLDPLSRNLTENVAAVQFDHRLLATLTAALVAVTLLAGLRRRQPAPLRSALIALGAAVSAQYFLGVYTLVRIVPVGLAAAHQAMAVVVLTTSLVALHSAREVTVTEGAQRRARPQMSIRISPGTSQ